MFKWYEKDIQDAKNGNTQDAQHIIDAFTDIEL